MTARPLITIENLGYQYALADTLALDNINLTIHEGEYIAVVGAAGAGKTSLCLSLNGIIPHMMMGGMVGRVLVDGQNTEETQVRELARVVGFVFDNPEFQLSQMTVMEEVALGLENVGVPRDEMLERIDEALAVVGLRGFEHRSPMALSGGQQQRLAIASALAMYPRVLVLDEPTSNLDPIGKEEVFAVTTRLNRERGMTVVIVEHEVEVIAAYADRIIVMDGGKIVLAGAPAEVFSQVGVLEKVGVRVPQVTELAYQLERRGFAFGDYPVTLEQALQLLPEVSHG